MCVWFKKGGSGKSARGSRGISSIMSIWNWTSSANLEYSRMERI